MSFASCTAHVEGISPFPSSVCRVSELMKKFSVESAAEVNGAELLRCILRGVECRSLFPVKRSNFAASESSERFPPPELSDLIHHSRYQEMAVIAATHASKLFREKPPDLFSAYGCLNVRKPFFDSRHCQVAHCDFFERNCDKPMPLRES